MPDLGYEICAYDEGFISGLLESFSGSAFEVKEVDCWCTGDRTCRFTAERKVDIDFFKRVNDTFGHSGGDRVLKKVATVAQETVRDDDILARYGGEEFIILLPETSGMKAASVAERIRKHLEETPIHTEACEIRITASFGVSDLPDSMNSKSKENILLELVNHADGSLYEAKRTGKNRVAMHTHGKT